MRTVYWLFSLVMIIQPATGQSVEKKLEIALQGFESDPQARHAQVALFVVDSKTGKTIFDRNSNVGLPAASSQKVITATTALELLGSSYWFKTTLGYSGSINNGTLTGDVYLTGYGDPSLGSDRFTNTTAQSFLATLVNELKKNKIEKINGTVYLVDAGFSFQPIPGGWIWDDIGNYYGAGSWGLNWRENQYDLVLKPGATEGNDVQIIKTIPELQVPVFINRLSTGKKGSGDNAYIYLPPFSNTAFVTGTIPPGVKEFTISGSFANPLKQLQYELSAAFQKQGIKGDYRFITKVDAMEQNLAIAAPEKMLYTWYSPPLDSLVYWFLRKSINLYGEALIKAIALEKNSYGATEQGLTEVFNFWQVKGIDSTAITMQDGSGLSPQNRITGQSFVQVLQYAKTRPWFQRFYNALPEYNGIKMKSGTIGGVKSFTGYIKSSSGTDYTFAIIVSNYAGESSPMIRKIYRVLDVLK